MCRQGACGLGVAHVWLTRALSRKRRRCYGCGASVGPSTSIGIGAGGCAGVAAEGRATGVAVTGRCGAGVAKTGGATCIGRAGIACAGKAAAGNWGGWLSTTGGAAVGAAAGASR